MRNLKQTIETELNLMIRKGLSKYDLGFMDGLGWVLEQIKIPECPDPPEKRIILKIINEYRMREPENLKELIDYLEWSYARMEDDTRVICSLTDGDGFHELLNDLKKHEQSK